MAAVVPLAFSAGTASTESWIGAQYGWTARPAADCRPMRAVCSTENGGATWHGIFNGGSIVFGVARTSPTAGVVSTGNQQSVRFWTRDNGRHWYRSSQIGREFQGSDSYLFWHNVDGLLRQVRPWPPRGVARCRGVWTNSAFSTRRVRGGNVCSGPAVDAGSRSVVVTRVDNGRLASLANVPAGVIAAVTGATNNIPQVLLYRRGSANVIALPPAAGLMPCAGANQEPIVAWPRITVLGCRGGAVVGSWISQDGGLSWMAQTA